MLLFFLMSLILDLEPVANIGELSPAELRIHQAKTALKNGQDRNKSSVKLAMALAARARETADPSLLEQGMRRLAPVLEAHPQDLSARTARTWILLGQHRFEEALEEARSLHSEYPDSLFVLGTLVDAYVELGHYDEALDAAQWMVDMRPGDVSGLTRAAYLRQIFGDLTGALELMTSAYQRIHPNETEHRAWVLVHSAQLSRQLGHLDTAFIDIERALALFPDYHYALHERALIRKEAGDMEGALSDLEKLYDVAPHPENLMEVAKCLTSLGREKQAKDLFKSFEASALQESGNIDNANLALAEYFLSEGKKPQKAKQLMKRERERRGDVMTRLMYARSLSSSSDREALCTELDFLSALGFRSPEASLQLGHLAVNANRADLAKKFYEDAVELAPMSSFGRAAAKTLENLSGEN